MTRRCACLVVFILSLAVPVSAQLFGGVVFDPTNYGNALLRYAQLQQQYAQLVTTYQQIRTQYLLLRQQAQLLPVAMQARYQSLRTPWRALAAPTAYGTTAGWIATANTGHDAPVGYTRATLPLLTYGGVLRALSAEETARVETRYDRLQLADATITNGLEALGRLRFHQGSVEDSLRNLEADTYTPDPDFNTQIAILNKINATGIASARVAKDANYLLVSLLEQHLLEATDRRDAAVQNVNAHIAFLTDAAPLLARTTDRTTEALTTFRIP